MTLPAGKKFSYCPCCANMLQNKSLEDNNRLICNKCGFVLWNNPKPTTSIILVKAGKILLLQRSQPPFKNYWVLPGGYVEYNEEPSDAIKREVKEETGLDVVVTKINFVYLINNDPRGNSIDIVYSGKILAGKIKLTEHKSYKFFSSDGLPKLIAYKHRQVINEWFKRT